MMAVMDHDDHVALIRDGVEGAGGRPSEAARTPWYTPRLTARTERSSDGIGPGASAGWCEPHGTAGVKVAREP